MISYYAEHYIYQVKKKLNKTILIYSVFL